jgi:hypothetical protein
MSIKYIKLPIYSVQIHSIRSQYLESISTLQEEVVEAQVYPTKSYMYLYWENLSSKDNSLTYELYLNRQIHYLELDCLLK